MGEPSRGATVDLSWRVGAGRGSGVSFAVAKTEVGDSGDDLRSQGAGRRIWRKSGPTPGRGPESRLLPLPSAVLRSEEFPRAGSSGAVVTPQGVARVRSVLLVYCQPQLGPTPATLNLDVNVIETHGQKCIYDYRKGKAFQPFTTY